MTAQTAHSEAEFSILAAAVERKSWLLDVLDRTTIEDYTTPEAQAVFTVIKAMYEREEPITIATVAMHQNELAQAGFIKGQGKTLSSILTSSPLASEFDAKISTVKEMTARRQIQKAAYTAITMLEKGEMSDPAYDALEQAIVARTSTTLNRTLLTPKDMAAGMRQAIESRADTTKRNKRVLYSTFSRLNQYSGGFEKGDLIILSAETGAGKSAFAMNIANGIAILNKRPLLYLNSEMSAEQMELRWAAHLGKVSHSALRNGSASAEEQAKAQDAADVMANSKLFTSNMPDMQIQAVLAELRHEKAKHGIEMAIVDYIGRMDTLNSKDAKEWQILKTGAQRLKTMAQELDITVIMVAQLSSDGNRLAQASYMQHEADLWLNVSRVDDEAQNYPWNYFLTFKKARNVQNGKKIPLYFAGDILTFTDDKGEAERLRQEFPNNDTFDSAPITKGGVPF